MIRVFLGETSIDTGTADAVIFDQQTFSIDAVCEALDTPSLFGEQKVIVLLYLLSEFSDEIFEILEQHNASQQTIIIRERDLSAAHEKKLGVLKIEIVGKAAQKKTTEFNIWALTDALLARDKKQAWLLYREAIEQGIAPEEIGGILWWQMKTLLLVSREGNPSSVKSFVISKAKRALQKYSSENLERISKQLIAAIHEPRSGNGKAEEALEAFLLAL